MSNEAADPNQLLTIRQAANTLGVSTRSVWRLIQEKRLRARKIRGSTRIKRRDVNDLTDDS